MCTLTIIPTHAERPGFRLVTNRDELRTRPEAQPPRWRSFREDPRRRAIWPTDPAGGGTWVAANDAGLALSVLNVNPREPVDPSSINGVVSRGALIPALAHHARAYRAIEALQRFELERFMPFRLVVAERDEAAGGLRVISARWDRYRLVFETREDEPVCFVSSGLGDHVVEPRLGLFERMVRPDPTPEAQDAFHTHHWPERPEASVMMSRADARTVSVTRVEVKSAGGPHISLESEAVPDPVDAVS